MTYSIEQIETWAKEGQAINPKIVLELIEEMKRLEMLEIAWIETLKVIKEISKFVKSPSSNQNQT